MSIMCMRFTFPWEEQGAVKPPGHGEQSGPKKPLQQRGVWLRQIMANLTGSDWPAKLDAVANYVISWFECIKYRETNTHSLCFIAEEGTAMGGYGHAKSTLSEHTASGEYFLSMKSPKKERQKQKNQCTLSLQFNASLIQSSTET